MSRWSRFLVAALLAFGVLFGRGSSAFAGGSGGGREPEIGPARGVVESSAPLLAPRDEPTAREPIPALPSTYVTKDLGWLELSYPPSAAERVAPILENAAAIKEELSGTFNQPVLSHVTVRVAPTFADMARLAPADAPPPAYASGVAYHGLHLVLLTMMAPRGADATDLEQVLRHELAHVALEDAVQNKHVPVWFNEGLAIWLSHENPIERQGKLWNATLSDTLIPVADLDRSFPSDPFEVNIAYAEAGDFMRFLLRKSDRVRFAAMIDRVRDGQPFDRAVADAYNDDLRRLEFQWHGDLEKRFSVIPILAGGGALWMLVMGMLVLAWARRKKRTKAILARWAHEEAIEDARIARIAAETAAVTAAFERGEVPGAIAAASVSVKTEQDGNWHTLH